MIASRAFPACVACVLCSTHRGERADQAQHSITDAHQLVLDILLPFNPSYCPGKVICIEHDSQLAMQTVMVWYGGKVILHVHVPLLSRNSKMTLAPQ